jgi:SAM-dependent methyltransferase
MTGVNEAQHEYWNRDAARHWVDRQADFDEMLEEFGAAMLDAAAISSSERVLDVGCGNGATTRAAARAAAQGSALGVDLSELMLHRARELALAEGVGNVAFEAADVQTRAFDAEFDCAISRFGVMFFDDPVAAFANIRSGLRDGGRVAFVVWQGMAANDWMLVPISALLQHIEFPAPEPDAPGPYALADPDRVRSIFADAGLREVAIDPFSTSLLVGGHGTLDHAVDFIRNSGISRGILDEQPVEVLEPALATMRAALEPHVTAEGVRLGGAAWLVTARR